MLEVPAILKIAADAGGFIRERFSDAKAPKSIENVCILPYFGSVQQSFVLSSLVLRPFREKMKSSKYFILCSWVGDEALYPCVDEYWGFSASRFDFLKNSEMDLSIERNLHRFFYDVCTVSDLTSYYDNGLTNLYFEKFGGVVRSLPSIPSSAILGAEFNRQVFSAANPVIFLYPSKHTDNFFKISIDFWILMVNSLLNVGLQPILYMTEDTYDLSSTFTDKCLYVKTKRISEVLAAMRLSGCVLDVFSGISRLAIAARCPYLVVDDRKSYYSQREYEIDDLCGKELPKEYIFSFPHLLGRDSSLANQIAVRLKSFIEGINRDDLPSTSALTEAVSYDNVKKFKARKFGLKFIKRNSINDHSSM